MNEQTVVQAQTPLTPAAKDMLQRQCACGQHTMASGECEACKNKREGTLQRSAVKPSSMHKVLRQQGQAPDSKPSAIISSRHGHDFTQVATRTRKKSELPAMSGINDRDETASDADTVEADIPKDKDERSASLRPRPTHAAIHAPLSMSLLDLPLIAGQRTIRTVLRAGGVPQSNLDTHSVEARPDRTMGQTVAPGGVPATGNASNDCTPSTAAAVLDWNVVAASATHWGVNVRSLTLAGTVNVQPWPSNPAQMVVPNTPNPVDGGNINNTHGSSNHYQAAIDDMADYNAPGGGRGPNWHSTAASSAHEWAHWNTDYVADSVGSAAGGNWSATNTALDALREPKSVSATVADARTALAPRVNARMTAWRSRTVARWNAIPDSPGVAGSTGYIAGQGVLDGLIAAVRAYATRKGWIAAPAP